MCNIAFDNAVLILDNLKHIEFELSIDEPFPFRIAKESHLTFYRAMIEALRGTANLQVTYDRSVKRRHTHKYKLGNSQWCEIRKAKLESCKYVWRFTEPTPCDPPDKLVSLNWDDIKKKKFLINFYEALAMVQSECFMCHFFLSKPLIVSDEAMKDLEYLHVLVRNEFEHFIPQTWSFDKAKLFQISRLCLRLTKEIFTETKSIMAHRAVPGIPNKIDVLSTKIAKIGV